MEQQSEARWYIVNVYGGYEQKVINHIKEQVEKKGLSHLFLEFFIPSEEVIEIRKGNKKVTTQKNYLPGYVLVKMFLTDETWNLIKNSPRVTSLLGNKNSPTPISEAEINRIMKQVQDSQNKPRTTLVFEIGEQVEICDGPFSSFQGDIEEIDAERSRLKVFVSIFGRPTPVDLDFTQVKKMK